jgi:hypothetical protein
MLTCTEPLSTRSLTASCQCQGVIISSMKPSKKVEKLKNCYNTGQHKCHQNNKARTCKQREFHNLVITYDPQTRCVRGNRPLCLDRKTKIQSSLNFSNCHRDGFLVCVCIHCLYLSLSYCAQIQESKQFTSNRLQLLQNLSSTFNSWSLRTLCDNPKPSNVCNVL